MTDERGDNKSDNAKRVHDPLLFVAEGLGYNRLAKIKALDRRQQAELLNHSLRHSTKGAYAILFSSAAMVQVTPYGTSHGMAFSRNETNQHYLTMHPDLDCKYMRNIFTSFELILFKICHIFIHNLDNDYTFESEKTVSRLKKVASLLGNAQLLSMFDEIWFVRNSFAHSFVPLDAIKYKGAPLQDCFGETYLGGNYKLGDSSTFVEDFNTLFDPIIRLFMTRQYEQMDSGKFGALCDAYLRPRSLGP